ncbi:uncharacterized protein LOC135203541 [Macrobrachium nipponense]|uniref:uncharacterized protein LOC135203541 n=1 Tax=Macrobrachium nipponense TaxID=159736 RepID=UPI0030C81192
MEKPKKKLTVQHMPSRLLSQEANAKFFNLLEAKTQALCTAFVNVVMSKPPERPEWKPFRTGVATLIKDHTRKSYYIQIYDLVDWAKAREEELKKGSTYHVSLPTFHQLETSTGKAMGLKFSLEKEAKTFAQIARDITMTGHYKSDGPSLTANASDEISTGGTPGERTTTATLTLPRPPPAKKTSTLSRPQRPKSMHREAPKSPPPPPPPSLNRNPVTTVPIKAPPPSPPTPPRPKVPSPQSLPSTPVNRDAPALIAGPFPGHSLVPSSPGLTTDTLDRKKPTKKITKEMIGVPTNFQHVSHFGFDPEFNFDSQLIQETMSELVKRTSATCPTASSPPPSNTLPSNPPPPNPPPSNPPPPNPPPSNPPCLNPPPSNPPQPPGNRNPVCSPASDASPPKPEEAALIVSSEPSREKEQTSVCEKPRTGALEALPTSAETPLVTQVNDAMHYDTKLVEEVAVQETAEGNKPETQAILLSEEPVHKAASDTPMKLEEVTWKRHFIAQMFVIPLLNVIVTLK